MSPTRSWPSPSHAAGSHDWLPQNNWVPGPPERRDRWIQFAQSLLTVAHQPRAGCIRLVLRLHIISFIKRAGLYNTLYLIFVLFKYMYMCVRSGNIVSSSFCVYNGVKQGGILSPTLFNVYMDSLSTSLNSTNIGGILVANF